MDKLTRERGAAFPPRPEGRGLHAANLMTFNNDLDYDLATLEAYNRFRREAVTLGIRHFLEVFNPNTPAGLADGQIGAFVNDSIIRALAGVTGAQRPLFLKVAYNGPDALAELAGYDPSLVVGILGGSAGTTRPSIIWPRSSRYR